MTPNQALAKFRSWSYSSSMIVVILAIFSAANLLFFDPVLPQPLVGFVLAVATLAVMHTLYLPFSVALSRSSNELNQFTGTPPLLLSLGSIATWALAPALKASLPESHDLVRMAIDSPWYGRFYLSTCAVGVVSFSLWLWAAARLERWSGSIWSDKGLGLPRVALVLPSPKKTKSKAAAPQGAPSTIDPRYVARPSHHNFASIHGMEELKADLLRHLQTWHEGQGNGMLFFGPPGTGKTMIANAIAGELELPILKITQGDLASKWLNETTENLLLAFNSAAAQSPCVLFIDEADSLLSHRNGRSSHEENNKSVATFLAKVDDLRRTHPQVLVIAATNFRDNLDSAAARVGRFDFPVEIPLPDLDARRHIIEVALAKQEVSISPALLERTVRRMGGLNIPTIMRSITSACEIALKEQRKELSFNDLMAGQRSIQGFKGGAAEGAKGIRELFYSPEVKDALEREAASLRDLGDFEDFGGEMTKGLMLAGPPGTGKTAAAQAFAKETGWPILVYSGKDLMSHGAIDRLKERANAMRPAIVFIDEADDILGNRDMSMHKEATNELLQAIDGAGGQLHDIFWLIATNKPEMMDEASVRGGRFGKRIDLGLPDHDVMTELVSWWVVRNRGFIDAPDGMQDAWASDAAEVLAGLSQASALAALKDAKNIAAARALQDKSAPKISLQCVIQARSMMAG